MISNYTGTLGKSVAISQSVLTRFKNLESMDGIMSRHEDKAVDPASKQTIIYHRVPVMLLSVDV